jgi:voltage-gated sodium channel
MEIVGKLYAFQWVFWTEGWNVFDFAVVMVSIVELILKAAGTDGAASGVTVFRLFRVFRVLRLAAFVERLNMLVEAFLDALKSVLWVGILLMMVLYMFSVVSQGMFGKSTRLKAEVPEVTTWFGTVPRSMATLLQMMTLDNWSTVARPIGDVSACLVRERDPHQTYRWLLSTAVPVVVLTVVLPVALGCFSSFGLGSHRLVS